MTILLEDGGTFTVQKALLCHTSQYFVGALDRGFKEDTEKQLHLPGCSTKTFELLLYWICHLELQSPFETIDEEHGRDTRDDLAYEIQERLVRLWAIADRLMMPKLQDRAVDCLIEVFKEFSAAVGAVKTAFEDCAVDSSMARTSLDKAR